MEIEIIHKIINERKVEESGHVKYINRFDIPSIQMAKILHSDYMSEQDIETEKNRLRKEVESGKFMEEYLARLN